MTTTSFDHLLSRGQINKLHLKNRIVMAPMGTFSDNRDGSVSAQQLQYYETRAAGGVGLIMLEGQYITNKTDPWIDYVTTADTDLQMRSWAAIVEACHAQGAAVCLQLSCGLGRNAFPFTDAQMVSASEVPSFYFPDRLCRALSIEEVRDIVESYRRAAARPLVAEADAIEIHAHAGYMIDQFMTPICRIRTFSVRRPRRPMASRGMRLDARQWVLLDVNNCACEPGSGEADNQLPTDAVVFGRGMADPG